MQRITDGMVARFLIIPAIYQNPGFARERKKERRQSSWTDSASFRPGRSGGGKRLLHQKTGARTLDLAGDLAVQVCRHSREAAGQNFPTFRHEAFQHLRIFVVDRFDSQINPAAGHRAVCPTKIRAAFCGFRLHDELLGFAMKRVALQVRIILLFFEPVWSARALFVSFRHISRNGFAECSRLGAFESDDFLCHDFGLWV